MMINIVRYKYDTSSEGKSLLTVHSKCGSDLGFFRHPCCFGMHESPVNAGMRGSPHIIQTSSAEEQERTGAITFYHQVYKQERDMYIFKKYVLIDCKLRVTERGKEEETDFPSLIHSPDDPMVRCGPGQSQEPAGLSHCCRVQGIGSSSLLSQAVSREDRKWTSRYKNSCIRGLLVSTASAALARPQH